MRGAPPAIWLSSRGIYALLGLALVCGIASVVPWLVAIAIVLAAAFVACVVADIALGPTPKSLRIARREVGTLALGRTEDVTYEIENRGARALRLGILETPVRDVAFDALEARATVAAREGNDGDRADRSARTRLDAFRRAVCVV